MNILDNLLQVQKPGRYIGEEWNIVKKDWSRIALKILIVYPDVYEVGMSNLGLLLLYELLNSRKDVLCERCFAPWPDMENLLKQSHQLLFSLETKTPINNFDLIGFTLQHELNYTNILTILDLGGLKIWQNERQNSHPLIVGGGPCTLNPEPVADFFDFFIIGDAEEIIWLVLKELKKWKAKKISRNKFLENVSHLESIYVPPLYKKRQTKEGFIVPELDKKIKKARIANLDKSRHPEKPIVPYIQTIHDRINLEIMRGCPRFCRFCQARVYYGSPRIRSVKNLVRLAKLNYKNTGEEEICLSSLSTGDYPYLYPLLKELRRHFENKQVFINLPSLRAEEKISEILSIFSQTKRPALTFAPEVSSLRMKEVIGKFVEEDKLVQIIEFALNKGWRQVKLYYMLGLPGLLEEDLLQMQKFIFQLLALKTRRYVRLKLNFATFIPKPHTPLQWAKFSSEEEIRNQTTFIKHNLNKQGLIWNIRDYKFSLLEAILTRGDRKLSKAIYKSWLWGARFDSWERRFDFKLWHSSLEKCGINYEIYLNTEFNKDSLLPWEYIDTGIEKQKLWQIYNRAMNKAKS